MSSPIKKEFAGTARFSIQKRLGSGGFGVVYQAYDRERNSIVALKTLHQADAEDLYRFKKEFRALTDIVHPNLAVMYELFSEEEQWFFTMEMIHGKDFLTYVKGSAPASSAISSVDMKTASVHLPVADLSTTKVPFAGAEKDKPTPTNRRPCQADLTKLRGALIQLVEGLSALHQADKLHRDIKPSNVLVTKEGRVVILDFGLISDITKQGVNQVSTENIVGTPAYMSPEHGRGHAISAASDWYSVGIMLYEALTGELPFVGNPMQILLDKQRHEPPPPAEVVTGVPDDLNTLCQDLLRRDRKLRPTGKEILQFIKVLDGEEAKPALGKNLTASARRSSMLFVGREKELAILDEAWQTIKQGQGVTLFINGRSGMGKSTMVRHFLEMLKQSEENLLILAGRCYEQESVPYKALDSIIDLLSKYLKSLTTLEVEALLPLNVRALARLFPVLRQVEAIANSRRSMLDSPDSQELRHKAFGALRELLARLANKKELIIFIDDLQWGDLDSAALLAEILRSPDAPRLLLIGSYRSEETDKSPFLKSLFSLQSDEERVKNREIALAELSTTEAQNLVTALLGEESVLAQSQVIVAESGGSPFFIGEFTQYLLTQKETTKQTPPLEMTIDKVISARIAKLPTDGRRLLEVVAVSGQPLARSVAKRAAALGTDEQVLPLLRTGHLLRSTGTSAYEELDTYHDRIRESVLTNLPPELLKSYHYSLALALEAASPVDPERLTKHFQLAGDCEKASNYAITAAEQADEALAFDRAAQLYQQSLKLKPTSDSITTTLKIKLGKALSNAGKGAEAAKAYLEATTDSNRQGVLKLQHKAAAQFLNAGYIDEGLDLLNIVLKKVGMKVSNTPMSTILSIIVGRTKLWLRGLKYQEHTEAEVSPRLLTHIDVCWTAVDFLISVDMMQAINFQTRHLLLALKAGEPSRLIRALAFESVYASRRGNRGRKHIAKLIAISSALAEQVNKPELLAMVTFAQSVVEYVEGNWQRTCQLFAIGEKITHEQCPGENYSFALRGIDNSISLALRAVFYLGDINQLLLRLPPLIKSAQERSNLFILTNLKTRLLYIKYLVGDDPERASQELNQASDLWTKRGFHLQHYWRILAAGEIGLYANAGSNAWEQLEQQWPALKKSGILTSQSMLVEALHLRGRVALAASTEVVNPATYLAIAEKMAKLLLREKTLYGDSWAELILAGVAATKGRTEAALTYLKSAEQKFEKLNMALYAAATRYRRGELQLGTEGDSLITASESWMHNQQIKNPARMLNMLAPGRWT